MSDPLRVSAPVSGQEFPALTESDWRSVTEYLKAHPQIREVILSGGEPLLLRDELLKKAFERLRQIPSVRSLRLETRIVSFLPQRITPSLVRILRAAQPLYLSLHVNHPREITPEFVEAVGRLADAGIPLVSQTVLLREINDKAQVLSDLFSSLYELRVRPYRLLQAFASKGADHFRTNISLGLRLIESLRGKVPGLSVPEYVVDTPGGKIPLRYDSILSRNRKRVMLRNHEGKIFVCAEKNFSS
jgi:lysine 2,3-aminomutase